MRVSRTLVVIMILVLAVSALATIINLPSNTSYSPFNNGDMGYSKLITLLDAEVISSVQDIKPSNYDYVVIIPFQKHSINTSMYRVIRELILNGVIIIIMDEHGYSNRLLNELGLNITITTQPILDEVNKVGNRFYPLIRVVFPYLNKAMNITTYKPRYMILSTDVINNSVIGYTSNYAYVDLDNNGYYSLNESMNQYIVVYGRKVGNGAIIIIPDLDIGTNALINEADNTEFFKVIASGRRTYFYIGNLQLSFLDRIKYVLAMMNITAYHRSMEFLFTEFFLMIAILLAVHYIGRSEFESNRFTLLANLYLVAIGIYLVIYGNALFPIIPSLITLLIYVFIRRFSPLFILASSIFYYTYTHQLLIFIPLAIILPYVFAKKGDYSGSLTLFLGPTILKITKYVMSLLIFTLIDINVLTPISIILITALIYSTTYFTSLSRIRVEIFESPNKVPLGGESVIQFGVKSPSPTYVVLERGDGYRKVYRVSNSSIVNIDIPASHIGPQVITINVGVIDKWSFSRRLVKSLTLRYLVIPITSRIIEILRRKVFSREEILRLISEVEISLIEFGEEKIPIAGRVDVRRKVRELIQRAGGLHTFLGFIYRFMEALETQVSKGLGRGREGVYRRSRTGEYIGSRDYVAGDRLKDIHWKKSISKSSLIVKEFGVSGIWEFPSKLRTLEPIVIIDLFATNPRELDRLVFKLLSIYLSIVRRSPIIKSVLIIVTPNFLLAIKGKSVDILYNLYKSLEKSLPYILFSYESISEPLKPEIVEKLLSTEYRPRPLATLIYSSKLFTNTISKLLVSNNVVPPKPFTAIHSKSLSFRYSILRHELSNMGYVYVEPEKAALITTT